MNTFEGKLIPEQIKVGIVAARFNEFITSKLLSGAIDGLVRHDVKEEDIDVAWVPGQEMVENLQFEEDEEDIVITDELLAAAHADD